MKNFSLSSWMALLAKVDQDRDLGLPFIRLVRCSHSSHLSLVYGDSLSKDVIPEELDGGLVETTFLGLGGRTEDTLERSVTIRNLHGKLFRGTFNRSSLPPVN